MTVVWLKAILSGLPDNMPVIVGSDDGLIIALRDDWMIKKNEETELDELILMSS